MHVPSLELDIRTNGLKTRLSRAVSVINVIPGDLGQCIWHLKTCYLNCTQHQTPQVHLLSPSHLGMLM